MALEAEVALILREGDLHLLLVVGVDDVQLGVAMRLHGVFALVLVGERHRRWWERNGYLCCYGCG